MLPYIIVLFLATTVTAFSHVVRSGAGVRSLFAILVGIILVGFQGFRNLSVGTDTFVYARRFDFVTSWDDVWRSTEIGYNALNVILSMSFETYTGLLISISIIVVSLYMVGIVSMTKNYGLSVFIFVTSGAYTFSFNAARQGIAVALCFFALVFLLDRRKWAYFLTVLLATLFHHTAIVAVPLYYLTYPVIKWRHIGYLFAATAVLIVTLGSVVKLSAILLNETYSTYAEVQQGGGEVMVAFLVFQGISLYLLRPKGSSNPLSTGYSRLLGVYLIGLVPAMASVLSSVNPSGILRLHSYFAHCSIILWPMAISSINSSRARLLLSLGLVFLLLVYYYLTTSNFSKLTPYRFYTELSL